MLEVSKPQYQIIQNEFFSPSWENVDNDNREKGRDGTGRYILYSWAELVQQIKLLRVYLLHSSLFCRYTINWSWMMQFTFHSLPSYWCWSQSIHTTTILWRYTVIKSKDALEMIIKWKRNNCYKYVIKKTM